MAGPLLTPRSVTAFKHVVPLGQAVLRFDRTGHLIHVACRPGFAPVCPLTDLRPDVLIPQIPVAIRDAYQAALRCARRTNRAVVFEYEILRAGRRHVRAALAIPRGGGVEVIIDDP